MKLPRQLILSLSLLFVVIQAGAQLTYSNLFVQYDSANAWTYKKLQLVPIKFRGTGAFAIDNELPKDIISFEQALREKKISIKEIEYQGGSDVSVLVVRNHTKKNVLVNSGEVLTGGKQDRVIGETLIIPPSNEDTYLTVFCAEKGRWDKKAKPFLHAGSADMGLRKKIDLTKRQTEVWKAIEQEFADRNKKSGTFPYAQLYKNAIEADSGYIDFFMNKFKQSDSAYAGFAIIVGDRIVGCEVFASSYYTISFYKEMITSYIRSVSPYDGLPDVKHLPLQQFLDPLLQTEESQKKFLETHGKADKYGNKLIHIIAYGD